VVVFTVAEMKISVAERVATETNGANYGGDASSFFSISSKTPHHAGIFQIAEFVPEP